MRYIFLALLISGCTGTWQLQENNDYFKPSGNLDRSYTQGLRISNIVNDDTGSHVYYGGQNIYTPGDKQETAYIPDDRPYAGYLYAGYDARYVKSPNVQDTFGINVGMVGQSSLAEQAQNEVHRLIDTATAKGWDNQIRDEVGVILKADRRYYYPVNRWLDTLTTVGVDLGNVFTQAYTAWGLRVGHNLQPFFNTGSPIFPRAPFVSTSYYLFAEGLQRAVARNIFLDGNTFKDSPSIEKETLVSEGRIGVAVEHEGYAVRYTYVVQSREFVGERGTAAFGEISIICPLS